MQRVRSHVPSNTPALLAAVVAALLTITGIAAAQESFRATHYTQLSGSSEVPAVDTSGLGIGIFSLNPLTGALDYRVTVTGMTSPIVAAHFHRAPIDSSGPVVHPITWPTGRLTATGTWNMSAADIQDLLAGRIYVNVHTQAHPSGEVRGQLFLFNNASALMSGAQEVPPVSDTVAQGSAILWVDTLNRQVLYSVSWTGLSGPATAAHFHLGAVGVAGGVLQPITFAAGDSMAAGTWNISATDLAALLAGNVYVNVHTQAHPSGEIRGQVFRADAYTSAIASTNAVPPSGTNAMGTGYVQFTMGTTSSVGIGFYMVEDASGPVTTATLNVGAAGQVGTPVAPLTALVPGFPFFFVVANAPNTTWGPLFTQGLYVNFATAASVGGEARGQLVPAATNLAPAAVASVAAEMAPGIDGGLTALVDRDGASVSFRTEGELNRGEILLYSSLGRQIAATQLEGGSARLDVGSLPSGLYLAQLVVDGRPVGFCRIPLAR